MLPRATSPVKPVNRHPCAHYRSPFDGNNVRLDLAVDRAPPEPLADSLRRDVGRFAKPRGIAGFDLTSQWRSLAVRDRRDPGGYCPAARRDRVDSGRSKKSPARKISLDDAMVVITVGYASHETRRIPGKHGFQRGRHGIRKFVFLDPVPYVENESAAGSEHAMRLRKCLRLFREEHHPKLAHDGI